MSDGGAVCAAFVRGCAAGPCSTEAAVAAVARRRFIAEHCAPQRALSLAACGWAAEKMSGKVHNLRHYLLPD